MKTVKALQQELNEKRTALAEIFDKAKQGDGYDMTPEQLADVRKRNDELTELSKALEKAREVDEIYKKNLEAMRAEMRTASNLTMPGANGAGQQRGGNNHNGSGKSLGELFVASEAYQRREHKRDINVQLPDFDFLAMGRKTLMETGNGYAPQSVRTGRVVAYAHRRPVVADLIPQTTTNEAAVVYMEETTFTNAAAPRSENAAAGESALAYTERSETVREIATWLPVTEVQLDDAPVVQSLINNRLMMMLDLAEEAQLLSGSGVAPELTGFLSKPGVQSQAKGTDPTPDAIYKAMTLVRATGFAEPSALIIHPNDWQDIRLLRTTSGLYIWGNPSEPGPERVWGLPAVITTAMTENTALLGDFVLFSEIFRRRGATIKVSDSHSDFFVKGQLAIRADKRLALAIYRASAFCMVTGI